MPDKNDFTPRKVLQQNIKALMKKNGRESQPALQKRSKVGQNTISRILSESGENARIETIAKLAHAYGLQPWQLMVPGMDPGNPPVLQPVSKAERALYERLKEAVEDVAKLKQ